MTIVIGIFSVICLVAVWCMLYLMFSFAKASNVSRRAAIKKMMTTTSGVMLFCFAIIGVAMIMQPIVAQAGTGSGVKVWVSDYTLVKDSFEFREPEFELQLQYKGVAVMGVDWYITEKPDGVATADISIVNGKYLFSYAGLPPSSSYIFRITAIVAVSETHAVNVPLTIQIRNWLAPSSFN